MFSSWNKQSNLWHVKTQTLNYPLSRKTDRSEQQRPRTLPSYSRLASLSLIHRHMMTKVKLKWHWSYAAHHICLKTPQLTVDHWSRSRALPRQSCLRANVLQVPPSLKEQWCFFADWLKRHWLWSIKGHFPLIRSFIFCYIMSIMIWRHEDILYHILTIIGFTIDVCNQHDPAEWDVWNYKKNIKETMHTYF